MKMKWLLTLTAGLASLPLYAHHSASSHYLLEQMVEVDGVVTKFEMRNPHARLYFDVKSATGEVVSWLAEGNSLGVLSRRGWKGDELKPGDHIKIVGRPSRDGSPQMLWTTIKKADGSTLYGGNSIPTFSDTGVPDETKRRYEDLRQKQIREREQEQQKAK